METHAKKRAELRGYLGAAPGPGRTFAMLGEAHRRADRGTDVVVGVVEAAAAAPRRWRRAWRCNRGAPWRTVAHRGSS